MRAKAQGVAGLDAGGVAQVLEYFCARKPCVKSTAGPLEVPVQGMGVVSVDFGEEVADGVERFAYAARSNGLALDLAAVQQIAAHLCARKECLRPVNLPPVTVEVEGVGTAVARFGEEPAEVVERFAAAARSQGRPLALGEANLVLDALCARAPFCHVRTLEEVVIEVDSVGNVTVEVGQEPSDAARAFLHAAREAGHVVDANGAEGLMRALCARKACTVPLDLGPAQLTVQGLGVLNVPLGLNPADAAMDFLEDARGQGVALGAPEAAKLMDGLCALPQLRGACTRPLNVAPLQLEVEDVGTVEVPFGAEPADTVAAFVAEARARGVSWLDADHATMMMERLCASKPCFKPLDVRPLQLEVTGIGTLTVPYNGEPSEAVMRFLLEARAAVRPTTHT